MPDHNYITRIEDQGSVNIAEEVIATIACEAIREVESVAGFTSTFGGEIAERLGKKPYSRGVKIAIEENEITVDAFILVQYGAVIADVAKAVQEAVATGVEAMTGLTVKAVNITVGGVAFEKTK